MSRFSWRSRSTFFYSWSRFLKLRLFSRDFAASRFLSRCVEIVKTQSRFVKALWVWKWWKVLTDWEISTRKYKNPRTSRSRSRQTIKKHWNFQISTNFAISIETFWSGHWCRDKIEKSRSWPRFLNCRD